MKSAPHCSSLAALACVAGVFLQGASPSAPALVPAAPSALMPAALTSADLARQGGAATVTLAQAESFSRPVPAITRAHRRVFAVGHSLFNDNWVQSPASVKTRQGLGPLFSAQSCSSCHAKDGRGAPPLTEKDPVVGLLLRISVPGKGEHGEPLPVPDYGDQIQHRAIDGVAPEAKIAVKYDSVDGKYSDGTPFQLLKPRYELTEPAYGAFPADMLVSPRVAPANFGMGLLEAIPDAGILAHVDEKDANGDGISGRANHVWNVVREREELGRFGWKANQPTVAQQNFSAFLGDMGITSPAVPKQNCREVQEACRKAPALPHVEIDAESLRQMDLYMKLIAVPAARDTQTPGFSEGLQTFRSAGCNSCHVESYVTGKDVDADELSFQTIRPYTDLLLHDMGEGLADGRPDFQATGNEWRTPPLWGIGLVPTVNGHTRYLHDGRARSLEEAVLWHGGEASASRQAFLSLPAAKRSALLFFLSSL